MRGEQELRDRLRYMRENLEQWRTGFLDPTEPDEGERRRVVHCLRVHTETLEWCLGERETFT